MDTTKTVWNRHAVTNTKKELTDAWTNLEEVTSSDSKSLRIVNIYE